MVTVTISVKPHLAAYMHVRFASCVVSGAIQLPSITTLYHLVAELTVKRPKGVSWRDTGNLTLVLPHPRNGKNPETYNYLGADSAARIEQEIDNYLKKELYSYLIDEKFRNGRPYTKALNTFMQKYHIDDNNESALIKAFQRWEKKMEEGRKAGWTL